MIEDAKPLRLHRLWMGLGFGLIAVDLALSLLPFPEEIDLEDNSDKLGHLLMYGSLMFWFAMIYPAARARLLLALAFCAIGVGIEFAQGMTSYRSFDVADMLANGVGVALTPLKYSLAWIEKLIVRYGET